MKRLVQKVNPLFKNSKRKFQAISVKGEAIIQKEKLLFHNLLNTIKRLDKNDEDIDLLKKTIEEFEDLFLIVIVGEFNAGKRYVKI